MDEKEFDNLLSQLSQGSRTAYEKLVRLFEFHLGINPQQLHQYQQKAVDYLTSKSQMGNAYAQAFLGILYLYGWGVNQDVNKALTLIRRSAGLGCPAGENLIGICYLNGMGVVKNYNRAFYWLQRAAEKDYPASVYAHLGFIYEHGHAGGKADLKMAYKYYRMSAEKGNTYGMVNFARFYEEGITIKSNLPLAFKIYRQAADLGNPLAQNKVGNLYEQGQGVETNMREAIRYYLHAAKFGEEHAETSLKRLRKNYATIIEEEEKKLS